MAIESASYISDLNVANPPSSDPVGQADDHIRLLKNVLKQTFPNLSGPVTSTQSQLNTGPVPTGGIIMWSGSSTAIPSGWGLCDGSTYTKSDGSGNVTVPDLRNKFIVCAGSSYTAGSTGGASSHTVGLNNADYALTQANLPLYNLSVTDNGHVHGITDNGHRHASQYDYRTPNGIDTIDAGSEIAGVGTNWSYPTTYSNTGITINKNTTGISVSSGGSNTAHSHTNTLSYDGGSNSSSVTISTIPPYYSLAFIQKL